MPAQPAPAAAAAGGSGGLAPAPLVLAWPCDLPVPTLAQERFLRSAVLPGTRAAIKAEPIDFGALPPARRGAIAAAAAQAGVRLYQAISLRAQVLRSAAPFLFQGTEAATLVAATAFEDTVEARLRSGGCTLYETQAAQLRRLATTGAVAVATPDFLLLAQPVTIHGQLCHWVEVKRFFACGLFEELRDWAASRKSLQQLAKYVAAYGPGAVVFSLGFGQRYRESAPAGVVLLDGSQWEADQADLFAVEIR